MTLSHAGSAIVILILLIRWLIVVILVPPLIFQTFWLTEFIVCRRCIYQHFKKNKVAKCPRCGEGIEKNFSRSVKRDPYKQSLVDLLYPQFNEQDNQIIKRCRQLFPEIDIQAIKDELDSSQCKFCIIFEFDFYSFLQGTFTQKRRERCF